MRKWITGAAAAALVTAVAGLIFLSFNYFKLRKQIVGLNKQVEVTARTPGASYASVRLAAIRTQLLQVKKPVIIMGDSIVESAVFPSAICGHPVVNAGLSGARVGFFAEWAPRFTKDYDPTLAVLVVGLNDAGKDYDERAFREAYAATLQSVRSPMAIGTITAAQSPQIEPSNIARINSVISQLADSRTLIELHKAVVGNLTIDGVHLNGEGYKFWTPALLAGARRALNCVEPDSLAAAGPTP